MKDWLLKTEPNDYSYDDLERDGRTVWDGVGNAQALGFMREMAPGDRALIYHTGKEKRIVGVATVLTAPYADPMLGDERRVVVDIEAKQRVARAVALSDIKADEAFADFPLVRISRLSVMPVPKPLWTRIAKMSR